MAEEDAHFGPGIGVILGSIVAVAAVTDVVVPATGWSDPAPPGDVVFENADDASLMYGLSAPDIALLATETAERGRTATVASPPRGNTLDGPLYTRAEEPTAWLARNRRDAANVTDLGGGWSRVGFQTSEDRAAPSIRRARVFIRRDGQRRACVRRGLERFQCDVPGWAFTGTREVKIRGKKRPCIWSHPLKGRTTVVEYGRVAPPRKGNFRLKTAIDDRAVGDGGDVDVKVTWGDQTTEHAHPDERGWREAKLEAPEEAAPLTLEISAESVGRRHFCFRMVRR